MTHPTPEYVKVTAWQNFRYNIYDWIASHGWFFAFLLAVFFLVSSLAGCASDLLCLEGTGACYIEDCNYSGGCRYAAN